MLIIIAAHIPIFALERHEGRIFQPMALSVVAALIASLILSLTLIPLLARQVLKRRLPHGDNRLVAFSKRLYRPVLEWALVWRKTVIASALVAFAGAIGIASQLGSEFLPELNEGTLWVNVRLPTSVSIEEAQGILNKVRSVIRQVPEVRTVVSKTGKPEDGTDPKTIAMAEIFVDLKPPEDWRPGLTRDKLLEELERVVSTVPGMAPTFSQPIRDNVLESISQIQGQVVIKLSGDDWVTLRNTIKAIESEVKQVEGVYRAEIDRLGELPQLLIEIDRDRIGRYGLTVGDIQDVIQAALAGRPVTSVWEGERRFGLAVRLAGTPAKHSDPHARRRICDPFIGCEPARGRWRNEYRT
jgi:cobalt-zinc-cadmium resistance protein CzcA